MSVPGLETTTPFAPTGGPREEIGHALETFLAQRVRLVGIARRITADASIAEDVVQEAWLRWQRADRREVRNPAAFLTTTTTRLAVNVVRSARYRHESPTGSLRAALGDPGEDPTRRAEQTAAVEETLRVLMTRLSPPELAAYVLRKGFDYPHDDIAALLRTTTANARQLARRGQQRVESDGDRPVDADTHRRLAAAFLTGERTGDLAPLTRLLADHAVSRMRRCRRRPDVSPGCAVTDG